jgi:hypothetical protein
MPLGSNGTSQSRVHQNKQERHLLQAGLLRPECRVFVSGFWFYLCYDLRRTLTTQEGQVMSYILPWAYGILLPRRETVSSLLEKVFSSLSLKPGSRPCSSDCGAD